MGALLPYAPPAAPPPPGAERAKRHLKNLQAPKPQLGLHIPLGLAQKWQLDDLRASNFLSFSILGRSLRQFFAFSCDLFSALFSRIFSVLDFDLILSEN